MEIKINHVTKKFKDNVVLNDVSCVMSGGKRWGIVGQNGSGKTMLLRAICGFLKLDAGEVRVNGALIGSKGNEFIKDAGVIVGEMNMYDSLSGIDNLKLLAEINGKLGEEEIIEVLKTVGLYEVKDKKYGKYSMGMKQRLKIAQAIMEKPQILILDEPFNGLDKKSMEKIKKVIDEYIIDGRMLILTSHYEHEILSLCNSVIEMDGGEIISEKKI